jgi:hypothetical protein
MRGLIAARRKKVAPVLMRLLRTVAALGLPGMLSGSAAPATSSSTALPVNQMKQMNYMPPDAGWQNISINWALPGD